MVCGGEKICLCEDDDDDEVDATYLGGLGVGEQTPVHEAAVANIGVRAFLGSEVQHAQHHVLGVLGALEEQLDRGGQELQLHLVRLVQKVLQEAVQQILGVVDALGILAQDPDHGGARAGLIELEVVAELVNDALVLVRVLAENILLSHETREKLHVPPHGGSEKILLSMEVIVQTRVCVSE